MGLNITPYDNDDNTPGTGSTVLRHTDQSTRLAWSTFGSVQSDPYRWGHATLPGYTPPADRPTEAPPANVSHPNLDGAESPETIYQSAHNGVPISGRVPAPANDQITSIQHPTLGASSADMDILASGTGTARVYLWTGDHGAIPVWTTSCDKATDPPPDYGLSACAASDGATPPWSPDMSGRIVKSLSRGRQAGDQPRLDPADRGRAPEDDRARLFRARLLRDARRRGPGVRRLSGRAPGGGNPGGPGNGGGNPGGGHPRCGHRIGGIEPA